MDLVARKPVFGVSDKVRMKPFSAAAETSQKLEICLIASFRYDIFRRANNKRANQTARIRRLVCAGVVLKPRGQAQILFTPIQFSSSSNIVHDELCTRRTRCSLKEGFVCTYLIPAGQPYLEAMNG